VSAAQRREPRQSAPPRPGVLRVVWLPGSDRLLGCCHCGAQLVADGPVAVWEWLLAHPVGHHAATDEPGTVQPGTNEPATDRPGTEPTRTPVPAVSGAAP
jgi:hypothetical protein